MAVADSIAVSTSPDGLAARRRGVVRSAATLMPVTDTTAKLQRARERLYVLCQVGGWGAFLVMQISFSEAFTEKGVVDFDRRLTGLATVVMVVLQGLLLTHYSRALIARWRWKELGWRALVPRAALLALVLSVIWTAVGYLYSYVIVGLSWPAKFNPLVILSLSVVNGAGLMLGWLCIYFFYHVFDRLRAMQVEQLRLAANAKEAELRALKSQVNPHFLFNSLNSLRALIDEDAPRARETVTRLANMLRYSLQSGNQETVALEDELRIVADYLALEQIRHENRLRVRWELQREAEIRLLPIPPMLLQTLVENAVKYGISSRRGGGEIVIGAGLDGGILRLWVTNPGDLSAPASASAARAGSSTGVGLRNASERLKILFGDRAALSLVQAGPDLVRADVMIPLNSASR